MLIGDTECAHNLMGLVFFQGFQIVTHCNALEEDQPICTQDSDCSASTETSFRSSFGFSLLCMVDFEIAFFNELTVSL